MSVVCFTLYFYMEGVLFVLFLLFGHIFSPSFTILFRLNTFERGHFILFTYILMYRCMHFLCWNRRIVNGSETLSCIGISRFYNNVYFHLEETIPSHCMVLTHLPRVSTCFPFLRPFCVYMYIFYLCVYIIMQVYSQM